MPDYPALHAPSRPSWRCLACGDEWPCLTRKRELKTLMRCDVQRLRRYMHPYLTTALAELRGVTGSQAQERFLSWCGRPLPREPSPHPPPGPR